MHARKKHPMELIDNKTNGKKNTEPSYILCYISKANVSLRTIPFGQKLVHGQFISREGEKRKEKKINENTHA